MTKNCNELKRANKPNELMRTMSPMGLVRSMSLMSSILLIALLFALSSCSKGSDEELTEQPATEQPEEMPILFAGNMPEPTDVTRAASLSSTGQTSFTVWGYKNMSSSPTQTVFPSYVVNWTSNSAGTTTSNSSGWEYILLEKPNQTIKFWDWSAYAYRFFAVTGNPSHEVNESDGSHEFSIEANAVPVVDGVGHIDLAETNARLAETPYFSHLWFSTGDPVTYPDKQFGKPVVLEFLKPYARVRFIFIYVYPREGIKLTDIQFKPSDGSSKIVRKGTVTVSYPIQGTATSETFTTTPSDAAEQLDYFSEDYDPEDDTKDYVETDNGWYTVLPNNTQGSYTMSVTVNKDDEPKTAVVPANYMQWLPGYSYTYIFKITEEGGVEIGWVESAVTPWTEMEADWTVYNW